MSAPQGAQMPGSAATYNNQQSQGGGGGSNGGGGGAPASSTAAGQSSGGGSSATSTSDLNKIVTDYLLKKGFTRTEATFRKEAANVTADGRPARNRVDDMGPEKYKVALILLKHWIENGLDLYKFELGKLLWPVFVYSFLEMVSLHLGKEAQEFLKTFHADFEKVHGDDLKTFATIQLPVHIAENRVTHLYRENKYRIPLNQQVSGHLFSFLEREEANGGSVIIHLLQTCCTVDSIARGPIEPYSFEAIYRRTRNADLDEVDAQEGIPGVFTGVSNRDVLHANTPLRLGPLPMEPELRDDVRAELEELDQRRPPVDGAPTLVEEFDQKIKREESVEGPARADLPLPPSRARDVVMEIQKVKENRDRFKIEGRTGGVGVGVSICMFTFHNIGQRISCIAFAKDHQLMAYGTSDSYIRVWSMDGKPLGSKLPNDDDKTNNRKLIGHSAPIFGLSFSDAIINNDRNPFDEDKPPIDTKSKLLLSSSADGDIRLWSLELWTCLVIYKGHIGGVSRVMWSPHGHYFASAGWDKTVRIWVQDSASAKRLLVGHDTFVSALTWHPNGTYVFSASDETDKTIRMWSIITGECVRVFTGHADYITSLECSPNGKILASADIGGNIFFWDLEKGTRIKRSRGHGKGGIPSMSFSAESNVLVSGGLDGTIRVWDVSLPKDASQGPTLGITTAATAAAVPQGGNDGVAGDSAAAGPSNDRSSITVGGQTAAATPAAAAASGTGGTGTGKKKGKEVMVTPDQISAFPTKKTPVLRVEFSRMNLIVASGYYDP